MKNISFHGIAFGALIVLLMACQEGDGKTRLAASARLQCFSIEQQNGQLGPSCDSQCAEQSAVCVSSEVPDTRHDCSLPMTGMGYCRCCNLSTS